MARPTSSLGTSAAPVARTASSTRLGQLGQRVLVDRPALAGRRTPLTTFARLNGSVTPLRLTTASVASSTVVNRRPHSGQERRRRMTWPSSCLARVDDPRVGVPAVRTPHLRTPPVPGPYACRPARPAALWTNLWTNLGTDVDIGRVTVDDSCQPVDDQPQLVDEVHACNYYM